MTNKFLNPKTMAPPPGYTYVVDTTGPARTIYLAGQLGLDTENRLVGAPGDFAAQAEQAFVNLELALTAVGATMNDVVKINNYLVDMTHMPLYREARDRHVNVKSPPASTTIAISQLARPGALFEVEAIAVLPLRGAAAAASSGAGRKSAAKKSGKAKAGRKPAKKATKKAGKKKRSR
jgi:enamine deaminase RidA (YjgF/YER057c/UK114 family)